jgi:hypothetical protein
MTLQLYLLGGFDCRSGTGDVLTFPTSKVRALFAYLATNPSRVTRATSWPTFYGAMRPQGRGGPICARRFRACAEACRGMRGIALPSTGSSWPSGQVAWK